MSPLRWVLSFFKRGPIAPPELQMSVVFYPETHRHYACVNGRYLKRDYLTGYVRRMDPDSWFYADNFHDVKDAQALINKWYEQQTGWKVTEVQYHPKKAQ